MRFRNLYQRVRIFNKRSLLLLQTVMAFAVSAHLNTQILAEEAVRSCLAGARLSNDAAADTYACMEVDDGNITAFCKNSNQNRDSSELSNYVLSKKSCAENGFTGKGNKTDFGIGFNCSVVNESKYMPLCSSRLKASMQKLIGF